MDFDGAISAHVQWKIKLTTYLSTKDGSLVAANIEKDGECALGKWIYGEGAKFTTIPEFSKLKAEHAIFHKCAGKIVRSIDAGKTADAEKMLASGSEYSKISTSVVMLIRAVREKAK